jgi:hypothetical protein
MLDGRIASVPELDGLFWLEGLLHVTALHIGLAGLVFAWLKQGSEHAGLEVRVAQGNFAKQLNSLKRDFWVELRRNFYFLQQTRSCGAFTLLIGSQEISNNLVRLVLHFIFLLTSKALRIE